MPSPAAQIGHGASITFSSGFCAQILSVSWSGISRTAVDTSHFGLTDGTEFGSMTFIPGGQQDPGELQVELNFNPDTDVPIDAPAENITVTWKSGATWVCSGFMTNFEITAPNDDRVTATATIKFSGAINITAAV